MAFKQVSSSAEGLDCLDDNPDLIAAYCPLELDENAIMLRDAIHASQGVNMNGMFNADRLSRLKGNFNDQTRGFILPVEQQLLSEQDPTVTTLEEMECKPEYVRRALEKIKAGGQYRLRVNGGLTFTTRDTSEAFDIRCGRRDILVSQFVLQSNNDYQITPEFHADGTDLTICIYLDGKGLKYKDAAGNIHSHELSGPMAYMHRGGHHPDVVSGKAIAPEHSGYVYSDAETRANMSIGLCDRLSLNTPNFF